MVIMAMPAFAQDKADWAFYGQARMWTSWESADEETAIAAPNFAGLSAGSRSRGWNAGGVLQDDSDLDWKLQTNSRLGANVKWGNVGGQVEFGNAGGDPGTDFGATWRLMYGTWNFGPGTLLVGKDYTPYFFIVSGMCGPGGGECNGIGQGTIYHGRRAQLKLRMGGFQFALVQPNSQTLAINSATSAVTAVPANIVINDITAGPTGIRDVDQTLPGIEASYSMNFGPVGLFLGGFYNTFDQEFNVGTAVSDFSIDSWAVGLGARSAFGPLYVNGSAQFGSNVGNGGMPTNLLVTRMLKNGLGIGSVEEDAEYMAAQLIVGFKLMDSLAFEGGVIWQKGDVDNPSIIGQNIEQAMLAYYIQAVWSPAKNVFIVPEFGIIDNGELQVSGIPDIELGKVTWFGIKWQINF